MLRGQAHVVRMNPLAMQRPTIDASALARSAARFRRPAFLAGGGTVCVCVCVFMSIRGTAPVLNN